MTAPLVDEHFQKFAILISYQGTSFCGWQRQSLGVSGSRPSIQEALEDALRSVTQESRSIVGSGRTDTGVHAAGQVGHFFLKEKPWDPERIRRGMNSYLSHSIRVLRITQVGADFHAQRSAVSKQYGYYYQQGPDELPHWAPYSRWIHKRLDVSAMNRAIQPLIGEHDFKPFQARGGDPEKSTVRTVLAAQVSSRPLDFPGQLGGDFGLVKIEIRGTGFLKQMVRGIAGTLLEIGEHRRPETDLARVLAEQNRALLGPTAPGRGLWLERVWYDPEPF